MNDLISLYNKIMKIIKRKNINNLDNIYIKIIKILKLNLNDEVSKDIKDLYHNKK